MNRVTTSATAIVTAGVTTRVTAREAARAVARVTTASSSLQVVMDSCALARDGQNKRTGKLNMTCLFF